LATIPVLVPELVLKVIGHGRLVRYDWLLVAENVVFIVLTALCVAGLARRGWSLVSGRLAVARYGLLAIATPVVFWRFDSFATLLMMLGLVAWAWRSRLPAGLALGAGVAAKLFPIFVVPVLALADLVRRDWVRPGRLVIGVAIAVVAVGAVFFFAAGTSESSFLQYHADRGVQIESLQASIGLVAQALGAAPASVFNDFGSFQIDSAFLASMPWLDWALIVAFLLPLAVSTFLAFRADVAESGEVEPGTLVRQLLATLFAVLLMYRVLSPQFLVWVLPLAALRPRHEFWLVLLICVITFAIYPLAYTGLVALLPGAVVALIVRNALMVAMFVWLIAPGARGLNLRVWQRPSSSSVPAGS
jgi:hypothetical protein